MLFAYLQLESGARPAARLYRDVVQGTRLAHAAFGNVLPLLLFGCMFFPLVSTAEVSFNLQVYT